MNWTCPECGARKDDFEILPIGADRDCLARLGKPGSVDAAETEVRGVAASTYTGQRVRQTFRNRARAIRAAVIDNKDFVAFAEPD